MEPNIWQDAARACSSFERQQFPATWVLILEDLYTTAMSADLLDLLQVVEVLFKMQSAVYS